MRVTNTVKTTNKQVDENSIFLRNKKRYIATWGINIGNKHRE